MREYVNEHGENMVEVTLEELGPLTEEDRAEIRAARARGVDLTDPDCPPMSEAMRRQAELIIADRRRANARLAAAK